jgi:hypothetical protein
MIGHSEPYLIIINGFQSPQLSRSLRVSLRSYLYALLQACLLRSSCKTYPFIFHCRRAETMIWSKPNSRFGQGLNLLHVWGPLRYCSYGGCSIVCAHSRHLSTNSYRSHSYLHMESRRRLQFKVNLRAVSVASRRIKIISFPCLTS